MDCYFYNDHGVIKAMCLKCHAKLKKGWHWPSSEGYGKFDVICAICGYVIYKKEDGDTTTI